MAILYEATGAGGGHIMTPAPSPSLEEADVVAAIDSVSVDGTNDEVASLFGIQRWTNVKTFRVVLAGSSGGIGHYGVGEWQDSIPVFPSTADALTQERDVWGWWYNEAFKKLGDLTKNGYDYDLSFKFDPANGEVVTLGGYILDTDTGCLCIRFANYVVDTTNAKVGVDITITRNDVSVLN